MPTKKYKVYDSLGNKQYECYDYQEASVYKFTRGNSSWEIR